MRVQPEVKMAHVKAETLKPDIAEWYICENWQLQRNPDIFCNEQHSGTNVSTRRRQDGWKIKDGDLEPKVDKK